VSKLKLARNPPLEEYRRAAAIAKKPVKVSLIGPDRVMQRFDHAASKAVYPTVDAFVDDVVKVQRSMIQALVDAGCKYVHIDEPGYTAYVDQPSMEAMKKRGEDPMQNFSRSLRANARLVENFPGVTFGIHLCRGNQRSTWHREGTYDAIAERLFNELPHQRFLLEYDSPRAGGFAPLRFVPKDKVVVLGLVSTKVPQLESVYGVSASQAWNMLGLTPIAGHNDDNENFTQSNASTLESFAAGHGVQELAFWEVDGYDKGTGYAYSKIFNKITG